MGVGDLNLRIFWPSTAASIPTGWTRDTAFDDRYMQGHNATFVGSADGKGADTDASGNHTHTPDDHRHIGNAHTHSASAGMPSGVSAKKVVTALFSFNFAATNGHTHPSTNVSSTTIIYGNNTTVTIDVTAQHPKHRMLIVIKPDDVSQMIPSGAIVFSTLNSHVNYTKKTWANSFLRGSASASDADVTESGATTHAHTSPAHKETQSGHLHRPATMATLGSHKVSGLSAYKRDSHHQCGGTFNVGLDDVSSDAMLIDAASSLPSWCKLMAFVADSNQDLQSGMVLPFVGSFGSIPANFTAYTSAYDRQIQLTETLSEVGNTGGSDTHTHTSPSHVHTHGSHTHSANPVLSMSSVNGSLGGTQFTILASDAHTHTWTIASSTPTMQAATVTLDSAGDVDGRYKYRTVLFLEYTEPTATGSLYDWPRKRERVS